MRKFNQLIDKKLDEYYHSHGYPNDSEEEYSQAYIDACLTVIQQGLNHFDINEKDENGYTILMEIINTGRLDLVQNLVEAGADVNTKTISDEFPLEIAARLGWQEIYDYLAPLTFPELRKIAEKELPRGLVYRQRKDNQLLKKLMEAAEEGNLEQVQETLNQGVDVNAIDAEGVTALHVACWHGQKSIVQVLLSMGANPNLKEEEDIMGRTPLIMVLDTFVETVDVDTKLEIVKMLIDAGADVNAKDNFDNSVLTIAKVKAKTMSKIIEILLQAGAKE